MTLGARIAAAGAAVLLAFVLASAWMVQTWRTRQLEMRERQTQAVVETVRGVVVAYVARAQRGELPVEVAQRDAVAAVRGLRYGEGDYFWINDFGLHMVLHPIKPELEGKDVSGFSDPTGAYIFRELTDLVRRDGSGMYAYLWPKPGFDAPVRKVSFVQGIPEWGWVIGSGVYVDDVEAEVRAQARGIALVLLAIAIGLALVFRSLALAVTRPLGAAVSVLESVAAGDLTRTLGLSRKDELGRLSMALDRAVASMRTALGDVAASAATVNEASRQLSSAADAISTGAQQQAASLQQTASSLEQMTANVRHTADNAKQASALAEAAQGEAEAGGRVVAQAVAAMTELDRSARRISDITTTVDEIAFQTNLLALNASVEAARAGEQGRGFAVVAAEVRGLAQRSARASREIRALIGDSLQRVQAGNALVAQSGEKLGGIVASVQRVTRIVGQIAEASEEQATGIGELNDAVTRMDSVTQGNAAQTEQLSGTSEGLATQADQLLETVARFEIAA